MHVVLSFVLFVVLVMLFVGMTVAWKELQNPQRKRKGS
jgi:hypothetical protein